MSSAKGRTDFCVCPKRFGLDEARRSISVFLHSRSSAVKML